MQLPSAVIKPLKYLSKLTCFFFIEIDKDICRNVHCIFQRLCRPLRSHLTFAKIVNATFHFFPLFCPFVKLPSTTDLTGFRKPLATLEKNPLHREFVIVNLNTAGPPVTTQIKKSGKWRVSQPWRKSSSFSRKDALVLRAVYTQTFTPCN